MTGSLGAGRQPGRGQSKGIQVSDAKGVRWNDTGARVLGPRTSPPLAIRGRMPEGCTRLGMLDGVVSILFLHNRTGQSGLSRPTLPLFVLQWCVPSLL